MPVTPGAAGRMKSGLFGDLGAWGLTPWKFCGFMAVGAFEGCPLIPLRDSRSCWYVRCWTNLNQQGAALDMLAW